MPEMPLPLGPATQAEIYVGGADELPLDPDEWESRAKAVLDPRPFDYIAGGAGGESTMHANREAFARWRLRPAMLAGNQQRDLRVSVLGTSSPTPFFLAPVGVLSAARPDGDLAVARAAAAAGVPWLVSTAASASMETIATEMGTAPRWYQLYWVSDREVVASLVHRAEAAGDARRVLDAGFQGVIVSNHGGRQVDGAVAALDALVEVRDALGDNAVLLMDSGIRRGADVIKALALGANAVLLGRPYVYGLAVAGQTGVERVIRNLMAEIDLTLALIGGRDVKALDRSWIILRP